MLTDRRGGGRRASAQATRLAGQPPPRPRRPTAEGHRLPPGWGGAALRPCARDLNVFCRSFPGAPRCWSVQPHRTSRLVSILCWITGLLSGLRRFAFYPFVLFPPSFVYSQSKLHIAGKDIFQCIL